MTTLLILLLLSAIIAEIRDGEIHGAPATPA